MPRPFKKHLPNIPSSRGRSGRRSVAVISVCLFPKDMLKLARICRGGYLSKSAVIRHLIRTCNGVTTADLIESEMLDSLYKKTTGLSFPSPSGNLQDYYPHEKEK